MKHLVLALALSAAVAACATTTSPTGRTQNVGGISPQELNQMGAKAFAEYKQKHTPSNNSKQSAYVGCVVNALTRQLPANYQSGWEYALFNDDSPNAFALPGGKVGINTGIFKVAHNQDQLAAVVAHEIGHVISRHHDERITRQLGTQTGVGLISALLGARYGSGVQQTAQQVGGTAAQGLILLPNNREQESEADVVGQRLMAEAGFDPQQAVNLWENMISASTARTPEWLSTHPDPQSRISGLRQLAGGLSGTYQQARAAGRTPKCG